MLKLKLLISALFILSASSTFALTMTFDRLNSAAPVLGPDRVDGKPVYIEDGITAGGTVVFAGVGNLTLGSSRSGLEAAYDFTTGGLFNLNSFDIVDSYSGFFSLVNDPANGDILEAFNNPYENILVQGLRENVVIAEDSFMALSPTNYNNIGGEFSGIDTLRIMALEPDFNSSYNELVATYGNIENVNIQTDCGFRFPGGSNVTLDTCTVFSIDNLDLTEVSPVPLPASFPLFVGGLSLVAWLRKRRQITVA